MKTTYTKNYIKEALTLLLRNEKIDKITISALISKAGVSRASFYRHYQSMDEVLDDILKDLLDNCFSTQMTKENIENNILTITSKLYVNRELIFSLIRSNLEFSLYKIIYSATIKNINDLNVMNNPYQPHFFAGASSQLIIAWAKNNFKETPEELTKIIMNTIKGFLELNF